MIDLTPLDVRKKKGDFKRGMRGYDAALVDDFLDLAADRMEELVRQVMGLQEKVDRLERAETEHKEREKALTEALVTAQEMRAEVRNQALREAEIARKEAEQDARRIRAEALEAKEREKEGIRQLQARRAQLVRSFRTFLEREVAELEVMARSLSEDEEPPARERSASVARTDDSLLSAADDRSTSTEAEEDALVREMNAILAQQSGPVVSGPVEEPGQEAEVELFLSDDDVVAADTTDFVDDEDDHPGESMGLTLRGDENNQARRPEPGRGKRDEGEDDSDDLLSRMFEH